MIKGMLSSIFKKFNQKSRSQGSKNVKKMTVLSSYLYNSKSYYPILISFGWMVKNYKSKTKLDSQENWLKVKVTGQGHKGQITI